MVVDDDNDVGVGRRGVAVLRVSGDIHSLERQSRGCCTGSPIKLGSEIPESLLPELVSTTSKLPKRSVTGKVSSA